MTKRFAGDKRVWTIAAAFTGAMIAVLLWVSGTLDIWEARTWDYRCRFMAEKGAATEKICLIMVDQQSLDWGAEVNHWSWPWPRQIYGAILGFCRQGGAKGIGADILFLEPSGYGVEDDALLGKAVSDARNVAAAVFLGTKTGETTKWPETLPPPDFHVQGFEKWRHETGTDGWIYPRAGFPIPELAEHAGILCNVHLDPDPDGVYRKIKLFSVFDNRHIPSLGLGLFLMDENKPEIRIEPGRFHIGNRVVPIDAGGNAILRYRGPSGTHKAFSAAAVLRSYIQVLEGSAPDIDPAVFRDKYVFIGYSAPGLFDQRPTPVSGVYPGVEIHATLLDNLISGDFMKIFPSGIAVCVIFTLALGCAASASYYTNPAAIVLFAALFAAIPVTASIACFSAGYWFPVVVCETTVLGTFLLSLAVNYSTEGRQKRFIKNAFAQYLNPSLIDQLIKNPERLKLGGEKRELSIFFSDIQGFTSISEHLEPEDLTDLLNTFLTAMTDLIIETGGTVDKYEGDAIIAFWNAPMDVPDHAKKCVESALNCQKKLEHMQPEFNKRIGQDLKMRIGMNTGEAVVGNFGSETKFDYTMLGDAVNLAARLEGTNKQFGTYTMVSESTWWKINDSFAGRELGRVAVVGRKEPVRVFEPMFREDYEARKEIFETFANGLSLFYEGRFSDAEAVFSTIAMKDPAAASYEKKCRELGDRGEPDWQGVWVMTSK